VAAVDESFGEIEFPTIVEVTSDRRENSVEHALTLPFLKTPVARGVRRVPSREIGPRCSGAQDPKDSVKDISRIAPRSPSLLGRPLALRTGNEPLNSRPLLVGEVHPEGTNTFVARWKEPSERWSNLDRLRRSTRYEMRSSR